MQEDWLRGRLDNQTYEQAVRADQAAHLLDRYATPDEIAKAALFLSCDDSSFSTGSVAARRRRADRGMTSARRGHLRCGRPGVNPPGPVLGCLADDFTGADWTVAAGTFSAGLDTVIVTAGRARPRAAEADVVVVALKSRTAPVDRAVTDSLRAATSLLTIGAQQLFFKYCSTFDSTPPGTSVPWPTRCSSWSTHRLPWSCRRTPLSRARCGAGGSTSSSNYWPTRRCGTTLTPMSSSDVPALLSAQSRYGGWAGLLGDVRAGRGRAVGDATQLAHGGVRYAVLDAVSDTDIAIIVPTR